MKRGLYLHIPFCSKKCHYCHFAVTTDRRDASRQRYFSSLEKEIQSVLTRFGRLSFDTLYFGGGTPSVLTPEELAGLVRLLKDSFYFSSGIEATCEMNPSDVSEEKAGILRELGFNRISLGAQTFNDRLLNQIGRDHSAAEIEQAMTALKRAGFFNISLDLMIRLPGQAIRDVRDAVQRSVDLGAAQVSLYDLEIYDGTAFRVDQCAGRLNLPGEEEHFRQRFAAEEILQQSGYSPYEISTFAKPGFESRHNMIYWHNQEYLGLGPGAFSFLDGVRFQLAAGIDRYYEKCGTDDWGPDEKEVLDGESFETEKLITGMRLREGIAAADFPNSRGWLDRNLQGLFREGLIEYREPRARLTDTGRFLAEEVFARLLVH